MLLFYFSIIGHGLKYSLAIYISSVTYRLCPFFLLLSWIIVFLLTFKTPPKYIQRYILQLYIKSICILLRDKWFQWPMRFALFSHSGMELIALTICHAVEGCSHPRPEGGCRGALAAVFLINGSVRVLWSVQPPLFFFLENIFYLLLCNSDKIALGQPYQISDEQQRKDNS